MTGRGGFTLVEAIVALVLSSLIVVLVSTTFLVQNQYYQSQAKRASLQDNTRSVTDVIATEVRSVMTGGVTVAGNRTLTIRVPMVLAPVCAIQGSDAHVYSEGGEPALDTAEVAGFAVRDTITGGWSYYNTGNWSAINSTSGGSAVRCEASGADTVGASGSFHRLQRLANYHGSLPGVGEIVMLFRETTYTIGTSGLDPTKTALFRSVNGGSPVEYATGLRKSSARFRYFVGTVRYDTVTAASVDLIDAVRVYAHSLAGPTTGGADTTFFGWRATIFLRNSR